MKADYNPYIVVPTIVADKMFNALNLAIAMSEQSYPHLTDELKFTEKIWREEARSFLGSEKIPASAKQAYNQINKK